MFVRFAGAVVVIALIALAGIRLEQRNLELRRAVGLQHYRLEVLERRHALHRLKYWNEAETWSTPPWRRRLRCRLCVPIVAELAAADSW